MENVINSFGAWQKLYNKVIKEPVSDNRIRVLIGRQEDPEGDIQNLRYFFPLASWLHEKGRISEGSPLILDIWFHRDGVNQPDRMNVGDLERVENFLNFINIDTCFEMKCHGKRVEKRRKLQVSRILPLCEVGSGEGEANYLLLKKSILRGAEGLSEQKNDFFHLVELNVNYIKENVNYGGTAERKFTNDEKEMLRVAVSSYLDQYLDEMDVLSKIVWMYILRELIEERILYTIPEAASALPAIRENTLSKSRMDAIAYGEAMYQLIENACIHSSGQKAWFGMRIHRAGKNGSISRLVQEAQTRNQLYKKYQPCIFKNIDDSQHENRWNIFNEDYRFYLEFYVLDGALDQSGMVNKYNDRLVQLGDTSATGKGIGHIKDLYDIMPDKTSKDKYIEDTIVHYGLSLLRDIVYANRGYLSGMSPYGKACAQYYYDGLPEEKDEDIFVTEWDALLPISDYWYEVNGESPQTESSNNIFGNDIENVNKIVSYCDEDQIFQGLPVGDKVQDIRRVYSNLSGIFSGPERNYLREAILVLNIKNGDEYRMEILSKSIFARIVEVNFGKDRDNVIPLRIVLILPTANMTREFVRLFSVFYRKGSQAGLSDIQIALCSYKKEASDSMKVNFILAGESLADIMENAKAFAYHHTEDSLEYIPLLAYLTQRKRGQSEDSRKSIAPIFPFDLFLTNHMEELNGKRLDINTIWKKSLFTNHINKILNTDLRSGSMGCKLDNIHIRLGSKMHVDTFYEAELLFHDTGNVLRFAYLITQRLLYGDNLLREKCPVLLLGYEKYSSSLILQVEYWLKQTDRFSEVYSAVVYNEPVSREVVVNCNFDKEEVSVTDTVQPVVIVPVGTSLSTIYKIRNAACSQLVGFSGLSCAEFGWNYCLIVANHDLLSADAQNDVTERYWDRNSTDREKQLITVLQENKNNQGVQDKRRMQSIYLIAADTEWHVPENCEICKRYGKNARPIIDMKYTDTIPGAIFSLLGERKGSFEKMVKDPDKNMRHMRILRGHIRYAHIYNGYNHFQFIFDFRSLFAQNEELILNEIKTWKVDRAAFHVLVSPLQMTNSVFIKALIDYVFRGKVRFLRLEFKDTYREEVRAKFSYIIEDFKRLKMSDNRARFYVHYADTSIVMGNTINRARLLVKMLLNQSGIPHEDIELFSKIYLLVNRCSYDTIHYFVKDPAEDLYAFIQLAIPSYNTENDMCPACRLTEKYELLEKRSSTQRISTEFARLGEKHKKRTREEYNSWLHKAIEENHAYLGWLKQWLYVNMPSQGGEILEFLPSEPQEDKGDSKRRVYEKAREVKDVIDSYYMEAAKKTDSEAALGGGEKQHERPDSEIASDRKKQHEWLNGQEHVCLKDIAEKDDKGTFLRNAVDLIESQILEVHDYMRLEAMQKAYEGIEKIHEADTDLQYASVRKLMLQLIANAIVEGKGALRLKNIPDQEAERFLLTRNMEWMMSYFKVLAREQISNYYDCRQAIMGIISDTLNLLSEDRFGQHEKRLIDEDKSWKKIIDVLKKCCYGNYSIKKEPQLTSSLQYQFHAMLVHRMAHLQSMEMTSVDTVKRMVQSYDKLLNRYFSAYTWEDTRQSTRYLELPSRDGFILRYLKSVKTATMTTRDDIPCLMVEGALRAHSLTLQDNRLGEKAAFDLIVKYLYLENVKILYYGMHELENLIPLQKEIEVGRSVDSFAQNMIRLNGEVQKCLLSCYKVVGTNTESSDVLYQNPLSVFCRFWHMSTDMTPVSSEPDKVSIITYMFHYYRLLSYLSEDRKKGFLIDDMPYLYEELCRCMCGITGAKMCYISFQSNGDLPEIFTQSGYYVEYFTNPQHKILTPQDMGLILQRAGTVWERNMAADESSHDYMLIPGVAVLSRNKEDVYLVIRIALKDAKFGKNYFFIVLQMEKNGGVEESGNILQKARNILFMREKMQAVLSKDYTALINFRFDCSYIKPYCEENKGHPIVLHISDLHVKENMDSDYKVIISKVAERLEDSLDGKKVDLLAVTGDLIDSQDASAPKVEQNYQNAGKLLDGIVKALWMDEEGYISHDWKRRVMIVTGNHDYASMNQFRAVLKHRTLAAGMPVDGESGTMSKFAYYIDFLIRYLDPPIDQLLYNDLNEIRFYRNLNIKVLMLNFSSMATPRRTNKMGANIEKVRALINSNLWDRATSKAAGASSEPFQLCLTHYAPNYVPNYFLDNYHMMPGWERDPDKSLFNPINRLVSFFILSVEEQFEVKYGLCKDKDDNSKTKQFLEEVDYFRIALENLQGKSKHRTDPIDAYYDQLEGLVNEEKQKRSSESQEKATEEIVGKYENNDLYQQLKSYENWCRMTDEDKSGYLQSNEQISRLLSDVYECRRMSETDKKNYDRLKKEIESKGSIDLYLCGHVHAYQEVKDENILIANTLYQSKGNEVNGYIITIRPEEVKNQEYGFKRL